MSISNCKIVCVMHALCCYYVPRCDWIDSGRKIEANGVIHLSCSHLQTASCKEKIILG